jgi:hypothetical protein
VTDDQLDLIDSTPPAARRVAGQHARGTQRRLAHRAFVDVVAAFSVLVLAIVVLGFGWTTCAIEVAVIVGIVLIDRTASAHLDRCGRGAAGEEIVGNALDGLSDHGWFVLHDVQLDRGNIDHVLVGPAGIFTIETKSHRGRLHADAIEAGMLKQAYAQAKSVERITGLRAVPLLVFSSAYLIPAVTQRDGVLILPSRMLAKHLQKRGGTIPSQRVDQVYRRLAAALPG